MNRFVVLSFVVVLFLVLAVAVVTPVGANPQPAVRVKLADQSFDDRLNPCINALVKVTWSDLYLITRTGTDNNGGIHLAYVLMGSMQDTAGFSSHIMETTIQNVNDPDNYQLAYVSNIAATNPDTHQAIVATWNFHVIVKDGVATVDINNLNVKCKGKPN